MPNQTGPKTNRGKAASRQNATKSGIYSVTPVLPRVERQADWLAHRAAVFEDLAPEGYMQEIIAERIAIKAWRLRRLVRYEREQVRNRQRSIGTDLAILAMAEHRKLPPEPTQEDLDTIDRWAMDALVPREKELAILMRWEGRLTRELRLDMLHLEHMKRQPRDHRRSPLDPAEPVPEPVLSLAQPDPNGLPGPHSLGDPIALRMS